MRRFYKMPLPSVFSSPKKTIFVLMNLFERINKRDLASGNLFRQILGALFEWRPKAFLFFVLLVIPLSAGLAKILSPETFVRSCLEFLALNLLVWLAVKTCNKLSGIFSLNKKEAAITWCQISILAALGVWIVGFVLIFNIQKNGAMATAFGVIGSMMGWIFQDKVKGVVAFIHLRSHNLLNMDDWIQVPKYGVDGEVRAVTLTTVTVYNWDTTTSTIPISALQSDHFINLQNMAKGKTYGRRMMKTFIVDTGTFHPISAREAAHFLSADFLDGKEVRPYLPEKEIREGALNAHLFRMYIYHWLMSHPHISQRPALVVRWLDQKDSGMPLQLYAFIMDTTLAPYEWWQSQIMEHVVASMEWFGLRLYQSPSALDVRAIGLEQKEEAAV